MQGSRWQRQRLACGWKSSGDRAACRVWARGRCFWRRLLGGVGVGVVAMTAVGQEVRIESYGFTPEGHFAVAASGEDPASYYRLLRGDSVTQITQVVGLSLDGTVVSRLPASEAMGFFRLQKLLRVDALDTDGDGLSDVFELMFGLDPFLVDSNGNGISDADEDLDGDTLDGRAEQAAGTDPFNPDTDNDGWPDEAEVTAGSDPLDPRSRPFLTWPASPRAEVVLPAALTLDVGQYGLVLGRPGFELVLPVAPTLEPTQYGLIPGRPRTELVLPVVDDALAGSLGLTLSQPPVLVTLPAAPDLTSGGLGLVLARPNAEVVLPVSTEDAGFDLGVVAGRPPVSVEFESQ
jgi:hypothetical protein